MAETTKTFIKQVKGTSSELGELLQANKFEEAFDASQRLNNLLKSEQFEELTGKQIKESGLEDIQSELKKYWWANKEMRRFQGVLRGRGKALSELAN
ncbi:hypothetical protein VYI00_07785 [Streptococcus anginosus]|nr:hypothetical protein [Streptococcus anginosus]MED5825067.1 hypothetical protein [Streptococcus anginosus]MED5852997.1 hypothetical protein [Streptococcus anginosus]MED5896185.1 hypothetical protein [Streptococcus anginosus]MED5898082.1 hypothetical protein [Streptococcus anginosus]